MGKIEWGMSSSGVCLISILECSEREPERPVCLSVIDEHLEIVLDFLIDSFCLSVCLWVVCGARGSFNVELFVQILNERGYEDQSTVRNNLPRYSVHTDDMLNE